MQDNNTKDNNNQRNLSNAFEELKKARNNSIQAKKETPKEVNETKQVSKNTNNSTSKPKKGKPAKPPKSKKEKRVKAVKTKHEPKPKKSNFNGSFRYKFDTLKSDKKKFRQFIILSSVYLLIIIALIIFIVTYISNKNKTENPYGDFSTYEKNTNPFNISQILIDNTNSTKTKEKTYRDKEIPYSTKYIKNDSLPKDEKIVKQAGVPGLERVNIIRTYEFNFCISFSSSLLFGEYIIIPGIGFKPNFLI